MPPNVVMVNYQGRQIPVPASLYSPPAQDVWAQDEAQAAAAQAPAPVDPPPVPVTSNPMLTPEMRNSPVSQLQIPLGSSGVPVTQMTPQGETERGITVERRGHTGAVLPPSAKQYATGPIVDVAVPGGGQPAPAAPAQQGNDYENAMLSLLKDPPRQPSYSAKIPAAWQEAGGTRLQYSPEVLKGMDEVNAQAAKDAQARLDAARMAGQEQAAYVSELQDNLQVEEAKRRMMAQRQDEEKALVMRDLEATANAISQQKIDPEAIWKEKGEGAKFMAGLAIGFGALGSALTGGPNVGLQVVQDSVNKNIEAQQLNAQNAREGLKAKGSLYGMMMDRFKDQDMALAGSKAALYSQAELKAKEWAAKHGIDESSAQYADFMRGLNEQKLEQLNKINGVIESRYAPARVVSGGGGPKPLTVEQKLNILKTAHEIGKEPGGSGSRIQQGDPQTYVAGAFGGKGGFAPTPEAAKDANAVAELGSQFKTTTEEIKQLRAKSGSTIPGSEERNRLAALVANRFRIAKEIAKTGAALSEGEMKYMVEPLTNTDALDFFSLDSRTNARIDQAQHAIDTMVAAKMQNAGVAPGTLTAANGRLHGNVTAAPTPATNSRPSVVKKPGEK